MSNIFLFAGLNPEKAFGQITVGNSLSSSANANTVVISVPGGTAEGNVMIAHVSSRGNPTITAPGGWTLIGNQVSGTVRTTSAYYRVAGATEPADYTWNLSAGERNAGSITTFQGVNTSNPINVFASQANAAATTVTAPSITTTVNDVMLIGLFSSARSDNATADTPLTDIATAANNSGAGPNGNGIGAGTQTFATAGATGTRTATAGSAVNIGFLVALQPALNDPTKLVYTSSTAELASGATRELRVELQDDSNTLITSATNAVAFAKTAGDGTVTGLTTVNAVNGVATLTVTGDVAGSITIEATSTGLTADNTTFTVIAGAPNKLTFSQEPTTSFVGQTIDPPVTVRIEDAQGNLTTSTADVVCHSNQSGQRYLNRWWCHCGGWRGGYIFRIIH